MHDFKERGIGALEAFTESRKGRPPYPDPGLAPEGESLDLQRQLEERYFSAAALEKYRAQ
jgi:hypothetical protein